MLEAGHNPGRNKGGFNMDFVSFTWLKNGNYEHGLCAYSDGSLRVTQSSISGYHYCPLTKREGNIGYFTAPYVGVMKVDLGNLEFLGYISYEEFKTL